MAIRAARDAIMDVESIAPAAAEEVEGVPINIFQEEHTEQKDLTCEWILSGSFSQDSLSFAIV